MVDEERKVLTREGGCGSISHTLSKRCIPNHARVVELVDSLASGASARKGVRVRLPPRAPQKGHPFGCPFCFLPRAVLEIERMKKGSLQNERPKK